MTRLDAALFKQQVLTAGGRRNVSGGARLVVRDPANTEIVGHLPRSDVADATRAIEAAHAAFPAWSNA